MRTSSTSRNDRRRRSTATTALACVTIAAARLAAAPAIAAGMDSVRFGDARGVSFVRRWALLVLWVSLLQAGYAAFLVLWTGRAAVWSVTVSLLAHAALYALTLGVILINGASGVLLADIGFQPTDNLAGGKAAIWCVCM